MSTQRPVFSVSGVTGNPVSVSASFGWDQNGACTITGIGLDATPQDALTVYAGWGSAADPLFNGVVAEGEWALWPNESTVLGVDLMARLSKKWGNGYYEYIGQTMAAIIRNLVEKYGYAPSAHHIVDSGRLIGSVGNPLQLRDGTPQGLDPNGGAADIALNIIRDLCKLDLWWFATRSNGAAYADAIATGAPVASYSQGSGLRQFRVRGGTPDEIRNKQLVKGLEILSFSYQGTASATSLYLPAPFEYNSGDDIVSPFLETDADCDAVAAAYVAFYNRLIPKGTFVVDGNLAIQVGTTVSFNVPKANGFSGNGFITRVTHACGGDPADFTTSGEFWVI